MATHRLGIIMHGVTGRMGMNQHLIRSVLAINKDGGVALKNGDSVRLDPILVGRNRDKLDALANKLGIERRATELDRALDDKRDALFFDAGSTRMRPELLRRAIAAGKHLYCEKPTAESLSEAVAVAREAQDAGIKNGVVHDKLFLPGLIKLRRLRDAGFFGRILSIRGEFGYWVFEGDYVSAQRPSWNYRSRDGGGIITDMLCHWRYVLDNVVAPVRAISCLGANHIDKRWDEVGRAYEADADDAAYATLELEGGIVAQINSSWCTRVYRDDLVVFQIDGTHGSAVAGLFGCKSQSRINTPRPVWNPDEAQTMNFHDQWQDVPDNQTFDNGFRAQWEQFVRHVVDDEPYPYTLIEGAKGVQLAELGLRSWRERRWIDVPDLPGSSVSPTQ